MRSDSGCPFCAELEGGRLETGLAAATHVTERFVLEADHWVAFPSVSPLRTGHVLVVPRRHLCSCAQASAKERAELDIVAAELSAKLRTSGHDALVFEHGVGRGRSGGCGIDHAHLHMLPCDRDEHDEAVSALAAALGPLDRLGSLSRYLDATSGSDSYALIGSVERVFCHVSHEIPSQTLRRAVAQAVGCPTWDWRDLTDWPTFERTYAQLA